MILLIDNYDSFVFNLACYIEELGFECWVKRNDKITLEEIDHLSPSHIILSPGPSTPNEAGICLALIKKFMGYIPILGVCLGHQAIGQACGGKIIKAYRPMHGKASMIAHDSTGLFEGLPNPLKVARYHSLVIDPDKMPDCLQVHSVSEEGDVMAISHKQYPLFGVQFHPESILTECGHELLRQFLSLETADSVVIHPHGEGA